MFALSISRSRQKEKERLAAGKTPYLRSNFAKFVHDATLETGFGLHERPPALVAADYRGKANPQVSLCK